FVHRAFRAQRRHGKGLHVIIYCYLPALSLLNILSSSGEILYSTIADMGIQHWGSTIPTCFATCSIQTISGVALPEKLRAIHEAGFGAIELGMSDLLAYGKELYGEATDVYDLDKIVKIAEVVKSIAGSLGLKILSLKPFGKFEGWKPGLSNKERDDAFTRARGWLEVMEAAGTDMLQLYSSNAEEITPLYDDLTKDLVELADIFAKRGFRIAFSIHCRAPYTSTWETIWEIVKEADRPNLGLCLNTFEIAAGEYADPTTKSGLVEELSRVELESRWWRSLTALTHTVPARSIYILQVSDAYKMNPPMEEKNRQRDQPARSRWSDGYRPQPSDGGYLPVHIILRAIFQTGFKGWLSMEVFDIKESEGNFDVRDFTKSVMMSLEKTLLFS
ncbi:unnamed protein product, partial [Clonostachys rosea f. rosea IK726]